MSVKVDESGRRSIQVEVEVPGTPEQVWQAIATGPGITAWFVPTEVDGRVGGEVVAHFGPGMDSHATVTAWEPPNRFAAESGGFAPGMPPLATEWTVEARSGGTCVVRVVHSLFASTDDWDGQLEGTEAGWPTFFRILEIYLGHFAGQKAAALSLVAMAQAEIAEVWKTLDDALGLEGARAGERRGATGAGAPPLAGTVELLGEIHDGHRVLVRLDEPTPGAAFVGAFNSGGMTMASLNIYYYGDEAEAVAARDEPVWRAWLNERFPAADAAGAVS
jgi:uncharacterized protein YndB with AHSA1/START domain